MSVASLAGQRKRWSRKRRHALRIQSQCRWFVRGGGALIYRKWYRVIDQLARRLLVFRHTKYPKMNQSINLPEATEEWHSLQPFETVTLGDYFYSFVDGEWHPVFGHMIGEKAGTDARYRRALG